MPAAFGIKNLEKGHFPYIFATPERLWEENYCGDFPGLEFFDLANRKPGDAEKIRVWWEEENQKYIDDPTKRYNLREEMLKYCKGFFFIFFHSVNYSSFLDFR